MNTGVASCYTSVKRRQFYMLLQASLSSKSQGLMCAFKELFAVSLLSATRGPTFSRCSLTRILLKIRRGWRGRSFTTIPYGRWWWRTLGTLAPATPTTLPSSRRHPNGEASGTRPSSLTGFLCHSSLPHPVRFGIAENMVGRANKKEAVLGKLKIFIHDRGAFSPFR